MDHLPLSRRFSIIKTGVTMIRAGWAACFGNDSCLPVGGRDLPAEARCLRWPQVVQICSIPAFR